MKPACKSLFYLTFPLATLATLVTVNSVGAQSITADEKFSTQVQSSDNLNFNITQGNTVGNNLFHSFKDFSVPNNGSAKFQNATNIVNIFSRVTGGNPSNINGLIQALGSANLFLINPKGIIFGPNASLEVNGSFFASTASSILFDGGMEFSAINPQPPSMLMVNMPIGLRFRDNPGSITIGEDQVNDPTSQSPSFEVKPEKTLGFVGGNINLNGIRLRAPGGRIELGALAAEGTVGINNNDFSLSFPENVTRADVSINSGDVDVTSGNKGSISINARNINLRGGSDLCAGIGADSACGGLAASSGSEGSQAGDVTLNALDTITIAGSGSSVRNQVNTGAFGTSGNINIQARNLSLNDGGFISASIFGQGNSGGVNISASDNVSLDSGENRSFIVSDVFPNAKGNSGGIDITITKGSLFVTNGSFIESATVGQGNSGKVKIDARDTVSFDGRRAGDRGASTIFSSVLGEVDGIDGKTRSTGGIEIITGSLSITNRAQLVSTTQGKGNAGDIVIDARDQVFLSNTIIISEVTQKDDMGNGGGIGNAGDIKIKTGSLILKDGSALLADTENIGNAGNIIIDARDAVILEGRGPSARSGSAERNDIVSSQITTTVESIESTTEGEGGNINISTGLLSIKDRGFIRSFTEGEGDAGKITVNARGDITLIDGSTINSSVRRGSTGIGGDINLNGQKLTLTNGSRVISQTSEAGNAGNIKLTISDLIRISGADSGIFANTTEGSTGNGGNIFIDPKTVEILDGAKISADSQGSGKPGNIDILVDELLLLRRGGTISTNSAQDTDGGNIKINTGVLVALPKENSDITSNAVRGTGGRIDITAEGIFGIVPRDSLTDLSDITANSEFGISGTVTINNPEIDPSTGLLELPETVIDPDSQIAQNPCHQGIGSTFVATGRGGLPPSPTQDLSSGALKVDLATPVISKTTANNTTANQPKSTPTEKKIVPAQGWVFNNKGQVVLTAYDPYKIGVQRTGHKGLCRAR